VRYPCFGESGVFGADSTLSERSSRSVPHEENREIFRAVQRIFHDQNGPDREIALRRRSFYPYLNPFPIRCQILQKVGLSVSLCCPPPALSRLCSRIRVTHHTPQISTRIPLSTHKYNQFYRLRVLGSARKACPRLFGSIISGASHAPGIIAKTSFQLLGCSLNTPEHGPSGGTRPGLMDR
jgi:hypothetical protein